MPRDRAATGLDAPDNAKATARRSADMYRYFEGRASCSLPLLPPELSEYERRDLMEWVPPFLLATQCDDPEILLASAARYYRRGIECFCQLPPSSRSVASMDPDRPLRIGYVSSQIHSPHPVGELLTGVLETHDRERFQVYLYETDLPPLGGGPVIQRARDAVHAFRLLAPAIAGRNAAQLIEDDQIDILVDLNGLTGVQRPEIIGRQLAPVIVNWLGFPGSMGSPHHRYIIADDVIIPSEAERFYSERVIRLPAFQPNSAARAPATVETNRAAHGLPAAGVVFCNFGQAYKRRPDLIECWASILRQAPGSVLWLADCMPEAQAAMRSALKRADVNGERVVFAPIAPPTDYLARYPLADLMLDTAPFSCPTTGADALLMGVPLLTMMGHSYISRACASVATAAGMPDLVCTDLADYRARAISLANDPTALRALRDRTAQAKASPLFDVARFTRSLESAFETMRADHLASAAT